MRFLGAAIALVAMTIGCGDDDDSDPLDGGRDGGRDRGNADSGAARDADVPRPDAHVARDGDGGGGKDASHADTDDDGLCESATTSLDAYCAPNGCNPSHFDHAVKRARERLDELERALTEDAGDSFLRREAEGFHDCYYTVSGCGADTLIQSNATGRMEWTFDHRTGKLIGVIRQFSDTGEPPCWITEQYIGTTHPACDNETYEYLNDCSFDEYDAGR